MVSLDFASLFKNFPPQLATFLIAALPIAELRASIPIALKIYKLSIASAYIWSVLGSIFPVIFILWLLDPVSKFLIAHSKICNKFFTWLFKRTRDHHQKNYERWGIVALIIFAAVPLPLFGAWSGSLAAFVLGIPYKKALSAIFIGTLIAGALVTLLTLGIFSLV